jgi:hypothetical protein
MYHTVYVSRHPQALDGPPYSEEASKSWNLLADGKCKREIAIDTAQNAVRFGPNRFARVFAGRKLGKLVYTVEGY